MTSSGHLQNSSSCGLAPTKSVPRRDKWAYGLKVCQCDVIPQKSLCNRLSNTSKLALIEKSQNTLYIASCCIWGCSVADWLKCSFWAPLTHFLHPWKLPLWAWVWQNRTTVEWYKMTAGWAKDLLLTRSAANVLVPDSRGHLYSLVEFVTWRIRAILVAQEGATLF